MKAPEEYSLIILFVITLGVYFFTFFKNYLHKEIWRWKGKLLGFFGVRSEIFLKLIINRLLNCFFFFCFFVFAPWRAIPERAKGNIVNLRGTNEALVLTTQAWNEKQTSAQTEKAIFSKGIKSVDQTLDIEIREPRKGKYCLADGLKHCSEKTVIDSFSLLCSVFS